MERDVAADLAETHRRFYDDLWGFVTRVLSPLVVGVR